MDVETLLSDLDEVMRNTDPWSRKAQLHDIRKELRRIA